MNKDIGRGFVYTGPEGMQSEYVPTDWSQLFIVLLTKSDDLATVDEFHPLANTSTVGKIFFLSCCGAIIIVHFKNYALSYLMV